MDVYLVGGAVRDRRLNLPVTERDYVVVGSNRQAMLDLGYRQVVTLAAGPLGRAGTGFRGHEFHYATLVREADDAPLFASRGAPGAALGQTGLRRGSVLGSFVHLIDSA